MARRRRRGRRRRELAARARELREAAGLTQKAVAFRLGVSGGTLGAWERGEKPLPAASFLALRWVCEHTRDPAHVPHRSCCFRRVYRAPNGQLGLAGTPGLRAGEVVRALREAAGLWQDDLAARLGVVGTTVGFWERGMLPVPLIRLIGVFAACLGGAAVESGRAGGPGAVARPTRGRGRRRRGRDLAARVRELRQGAGLSQWRLAFRLGVSGHSVSRWERGAQAVGPPCFLALRWVCEHAAEGGDMRYGRWGSAAGAVRVYRDASGAVNVRGTRALWAGDVMRALRKAAGLSAGELAARLGLRERAFRNWESGSHPVRLIRLIAIFAVCVGGAAVE